MIFTKENWNHFDFTPHSIFKVDFDALDINQAKITAQKKLHYTSVYDPSGATRDYSIINSRIIAGELADQAVTKILNNFFISKFLSCKAVEYDDIRQDDFKDTADFSILIEGQGIATKKAEVRSSFCYRLKDPKAMLNKLSIYGWYTSYGKPAEEKKELYFQVFYHLRPQSVAKQTEWPDIPEFEECLRNGSISAYVIGGADHNLLLSQGVTKKDDVSGAFYKAIYPSETGHDITEMCRLSSI